MKNRTKMLLTGMTLFASISVANAAVFSGNGKISNIRQGAGSTLQINHEFVVPNMCSTKNYAVAIRTSHPNFKNIYAAILMAKATNTTTQFAVFDDKCVDGFPEVETFTIKD